MGGVLIKPLEAAIQDGDTIRAIIRNTAVSQDGKTNGITVPSAIAQEAAIRRAYDQAGLDLHTDYVEAHGTGTVVGDPIEAKAIASVLAANRNKDNPLPVGSMKTNIGHLEAAAGIASLIKGVLMLEKGQIPPNTNFINPNESVGADTLHLRVPQKLQKYDLRRISINSFGFGGTNAHIVLEKGIALQPSRNSMCRKNDGEDPEISRLFVLSAHNENACRKLATNFLQHSSKLMIKDELDKSLDGLAFSLSRRSSLKHRLAFTCRDGEDLVEKLESIQGKEIEFQSSLAKPRLAFVFTGQGAQWYGMGRELITTCPLFRDSIRRASSTLLELGCPWDLHCELNRSPEDSRVDNPSVGQPLCTAIQISLVDALQSLGVKPKAVVGHSSGEIGAAYASGAVSFEDAIAISYHRGRLVHEYSRQSKIEGTMLAVGESPERVAKFISAVPTELGQMISACINSPRSVTVSGDRLAVDQLRQDLDKEEIFNRPLKTNGIAYHSHHMHRLAQDYLSALSHIRGRRGDPSVRWVSSVSGEDLENIIVGPKYWIDNLVSPVLFTRAMEKTCLDLETLKPLTIDTIIELGPHSTLAGPIKQILKSFKEGRDVVYSNAFTRDKDATTTFQNMLGFLFCRGHSVDVEAAVKLFSSNTGELLIDLPSYPWDHDTKYWHDSRLSEEYRFRKFPRHELLGVRAPNFNTLEPSWRNYVRLNELPWLKGHEIDGQVIWPGAAYVAMALEAARQQAVSRDPSRLPSKYILRDIVFSKALIVDADSEDLEIQLTLRPQARSATESSGLWDEFRVFSVKSKGQWQEHCRGLVSVELASTKDAVQCMEESQSQNLKAMVTKVKADSRTIINPIKFYDSFKQVGINWHDAFGCLSAISAGPLSSCCSIRPVATSQKPQAAYEIPYLIHPGTLDSCFQSSFALMIADGRRSLSPHVVTFIEKLELSVLSNIHDASDVPLYCQKIGSSHSIGTILDSADGKALPFHLSIQKFQLTELPTEKPTSSGAQKLCTNLIWQPREPMKSPAETQTNGNEPTNGHLNVNGHVSGNGHVNGNGARPSVDNPCIEIIHHEAFSLATSYADELQKFVKPAQVYVSSIDDLSHTDKLCVVLALDNDTLLSELKQSQFDKLKSLMLNTKGILWVTAGAAVECSHPAAAAVTGFARTLRVENPSLRLVTLDLDPRDLDISKATYLIATILDGPCFTAVEIKGIDFEYASRKGELLVPRIVDNVEISRSLQDQTFTPEAEMAPYFQPGRPLTLSAGQTGLLDTLRWNDDRNISPLGSDEIRLEARAHGINFRDLLVAIGQLGRDATMAGECSGIVTEVGASLEGTFNIGDRVCAFGAQAYANYPTVKGHCAAKIPDHVAFDLAASIPIVYSTVVYALIQLGQLQRGQKVLIHSATGGVGQAAVMLAQYLGAEIFATVGSADKKHFLMSEFGVPADHIFSSRYTNFREGIMMRTNDYGVDVVLNSLTGEQFRESCNCLAYFGRFIEIGKRDLLSNAKMDMGFMLRNVSFSSVDLMLVGHFNPALTRILMAEAVDLVATQKVKAVKIASAPLSDIQAAFRQMQAGKHMGKLILTTDQDTQIKVVPPAPKRAQFAADASYLIVGGLGGLGQTLLSWMADHGAHQLITMSRSGLENPKARAVVEELQRRGVTLTVLKCDVSDFAELEAALQTLPPIRGMIQAAMVLQDSIFENMTYDQWVAATRPKIQATANLHKLLPKQNLDFFIMLSSIVSILGNSGQAAYAAGNSYLDSLARHRTSNNLPAQTINVGVVRDAGFVSENAQVAASLEARGFASMDVADVLAILNNAVTHPKAPTFELSQVCVGLGVSPATMKDPKLQAWTELHGGVAATKQEQGGAQPYVRGLQDANSLAEASAVACAAILQQLAKLLAMEAERLDSNDTLASYGVDSLLSVELRNWMRMELKASLQLLELNEGNKSIQDIADLVAGRSKLVQVQVQVQEK